MRSETKNIFEISMPGRRAVAWPADEKLGGADISARVPDSMRRSAPAELPEAAEIDVVRHYTKLSKRNFGVDDGFYPLGSCTMKYNPRLNEKAAAMTRFQALHPQADEELVQGNLRIMYELQQMLMAITGFDAFSLQPSAGAHGEFASLLVMRRYLDANGGKDRRTIILPDSSHGTNPASCVVAGFTPKNIGHSDRGLVDIDELKAAVGPDTAGIMLTNPNTLGLFEEDILEIAEIVHGAGGLLYMDGANLNAIMGIARPAEMGFDVMHINLHKTFSTPHGGGGPGSGPIGVTEALAPYLPKPVAAKEGERYFLDYDRPHSIGKVKGFYGNFGVLLRAWTYIRILGADGLKRTSENAVLNANYLMHRLKEKFELPYDRTCMHEFVLSADRQKERGARALDIAKRLLDHGFHPPTVYFPLIVHEAMMIEPTETENRETLDAFAEAMLSIDAEIDTNLDVVTSAPQNTCVNRLDEAGAARKPIVKWDDAV